MINIVMLELGTAKTMNMKLYHHLYVCMYLVNVVFCICGEMSNKALNTSFITQFITYCFCVKISVTAIPRVLPSMEGIDRIVKAGPSR